MDIPSQIWVPGRNYKKDDIIKVDNIILPSDQSGDRDENGNIVSKIASDDNKNIKTDQEIFISTDSVVTEEELKDSQETALGWSFSINKELDYSMSCMVKKSTEHSELKDEYKTFLTNSNNTIDLDSSIGIGIAIRFINSSGNEIRPADLRTTRRAVAGSEINHKEYYNISLDIDSKFIPDDLIESISFS